MAHTLRRGWRSQPLGESRRAVLFAVALALAATVAGAASWAAFGATRGADLSELSPEAAKAAVLANEQADIDAGNADPAVADPNAEGPPFSPDPWPEGIFEHQDDDFPPSLGYSFENLWRGTVGGSNVAAYAGGLQEDPKRGVVLLVTIDPKTWGHTFKVYETPIPGPVRIDSADGNLLTLVSITDDSKVRFDVGSGAFG